MLLSKGETNPPWVSPFVTAPEHAFFHDANLQEAVYDPYPVGIANAMLQKAQGGPAKDGQRSL